MKTNITVEMIESIIFNPISMAPHYPYKYKKVEILSPLQNVAGLTQINGDYYTKVSVKNRV